MPRSIPLPPPAVRYHAAGWLVTSSLLANPTSIAFLRFIVRRRAANGQTDRSGLIDLRPKRVRRQVFQFKSKIDHPKGELFGRSLKSRLKCGKKRFRAVRLLPVDGNFGTPIANTSIAGRSSLPANLPKMLETECLN